MESVSELKMLLEVGTLRDVLQHTLIFTMIVKAFENDDGSLDLELNDTSNVVAKTKQDLATAAVDKQPAQPNELPPHKSFGAFISHKKVQSSILSFSAWFYCCFDRCTRNLGS